MKIQVAVFWVWTPCSDVVFCHNPKDSNLNPHLCENLKSYPTTSLHNVRTKKVMTWKTCYIYPVEWTSLTPISKHVRVIYPHQISTTTAHKAKSSLPLSRVEATSRKEQNKKLVVLYEVHGYSLFCLTTRYFVAVVRTKEQPTEIRFHFCRHCDVVPNLRKRWVFFQCYRTCSSKYS
jgi:hypothetical protein